MRTFWRLTAFVGIAMLALVAAASAGAAGNSQATYTCTKVKHNGDTDVRVNVPSAAVDGLTNAGFTCVVSQGEEGDDPGTDDPGVGDEGSNPGEEGSGNEEPGSDDGGPSSTPESSGYEAPQEPRSLYCATKPVERANGDGMGIALNLTEAQGQELIDMGLVTHAIFYEGLGASCDVLPGYKDSGVWVDNVGNVVPGVAVYILYVSAS